MFLDVPEPWLALHHVKRVLRGGRTLCCYSPCIEQVMKTCEKMRELGFHSIRTIEARHRPFDSRVFPLETLDLGLGDEELEHKNASSTRDPEAKYQQWTEVPIVPTQTTIDTSESQLSAAAVANSSTTIDHDGEDKHANMNCDDSERRDEEDQIVGDDTNPSSLKKRKFEDEQEGHAEPTAVGDNDFKRRPFKNLPRAAVNGTYTMHIGRPLTQMKGHTAFLTFAYAPVK